MTKKFFSEQQQAQLKLNPYVKTVSAKAITYTDEFKEFFIDEYDKGKYPSEIFFEAGFDIEALGPARPLERELSIEEKYARLEAKMKLLEAENEFLKKLDQLERQLIRKQSK